MHDLTHGHIAHAHIGDELAHDHIFDKGSKARPNAARAWSCGSPSP
jgi:hypothetical protein